VSANMQHGTPSSPDTASVGNDLAPVPEKRRRLKPDSKTFAGIRAQLEALARRRKLTLADRREARHHLLGLLDVLTKERDDLFRQRDQARADRKEDFEARRVTVVEASQRELQRRNDLKAQELRILEARRVGGNRLLPAPEAETETFAQQLERFAAEEADEVPR
jgi:hypothetical protein